MRRTLFLVPALLLAAAAPAHAAEGGLLDVNVGLSFWTILIFLVVLGVLAKFAYPPLLGAVEAREAHLRETIEAAERDRAEAALLLEQQKQETEEARARLKEAFDENKAAAEKTREELLARARAEQEEMLARARREIEQEREAALDEVRRDAVELALAAATRLVGRNLGDAEDRRLVTEYLGQVDADRVAAGAGV